MLPRWCLRSLPSKRRETLLGSRYFLYTASFQWVKRWLIPCVSARNFNTCVFFVDFITLKLTKGISWEWVKLRSIRTILRFTKHISGQGSIKYAPWAFLYPCSRHHKVVERSHCLWPMLSLCTWSGLEPSSGVKSLLSSSVLVPVFALVQFLTNRSDSWRRLCSSPHSLWMLPMASLWSWLWSWSQKEPQEIHWIHAGASWPQQTGKVDAKEIALNQVAELKETTSNQVWAKDTQRNDITRFLRDLGRRWPVCRGLSASKIQPRWGRNELLANEAEEVGKDIITWTSESQTPVKGTPGSPGTVTPLVSPVVGIRMEMRCFKLTALIVFHELRNIWE